MLTNHLPKLSLKRNAVTIVAVEYVHQEEAIKKCFQDGRKIGMRHKKISDIQVAIDQRRAIVE